MASPIGAYKNISGATTTDITASILKKIIVNIPVTGTIVVSDGKPGTTIATINPTTGVEPFYLPYEIGLDNNNIRVVTSGASDVTVVYE